MPKFSQDSFSKLSTCHEDLQVLFYEVIKSFDCMVLEGYRNEFEQNLAFNEGRSQLQWPHGKHNSKPSMAVDVAPYPVDFNNIKRSYWFGGYVMGIAQRLKDEGKMSHSVRWGADFNNNHQIDDNFLDMNHFEIIV